MNYEVLTLVVCILVILILVFIIHKQRKKISRIKHVLSIQEKQIDEQKEKLLAYDLQKYDEVASQYMQRIKSSPWKSFTAAAEQLTRYYAEVPEVYFKNRNSYERQRLFDGWAQELRNRIENARYIHELLKIFEGFNEDPDAWDTKLMLRIREAVPKFERDVLFEIWYRGEVSYSLIENNMKELTETVRRRGKEREDIEKMLNLKCLQGFFDPTVREKFDKICNNNVLKNGPASS